MGPELASHHATDGLAWAQCSPHSMLPMVLHGPIAGSKACYQWSCIGPALAQSMLLMVLHGPSTGRQSMPLMVLHGPSTDHQTSQQKVLLGPIAGHQACY